jgi:DivIVA domain-containing protein
MTDQFPRVGRLSRGYARRQVDTYLARVETAHASGRLTSRTTAAAIRRAAFDLVLHGYQPAAVDAALDELEQQALALDAAARGDRSTQEYELASRRASCATARPGRTARGSGGLPRCAAATPWTTSTTCSTRSPAR